MNSGKDYMGSKYSQQLFPTGEINEVKDFKEEISDEDNKYLFWKDSMADSKFEGKFNL